MTYTILIAFGISAFWALAIARRRKRWRAFSRDFEFTDYPIKRAQPDKEAGGWFKGTDGQRILKAWVVADCSGVSIRDFHAMSSLAPFRIDWDRIAAVEFVEEHRIKKWGMDYWGCATITLADSSSPAFDMPWRGVFENALPERIGFRNTRASYVRDA